MMEIFATPPELLAAWKRDCLKARATYMLAEQQEELARLQKELNCVAPGPKPMPSLTPQQIEEARMDAIAKQVNDRLRHHEEPRRVHHLDPAAPHPILHHPNTTGLNR